MYTINVRIPVESEVANTLPDLYAAMYFADWTLYNCLELGGPALELLSTAAAKTAHMRIFVGAIGDDSLSFSLLALELNIFSPMEVPVRLMFYIIGDLFHITANH